VCRPLWWNHHAVPDRHELFVAEAENVQKLMCQDHRVELVCSDCYRISCKSAHCATRYSASDIGEDANWNVSFRVCYPSFLCPASAVPTRTVNCSRHEIARFCVKDEKVDSKAVPYVVIHPLDNFRNAACVDVEFSLPEECQTYRDIVLPLELILQLLNLSLKIHDL